MVVLDRTAVREALGATPPPRMRAISAVTHDSRRVLREPGTAFVAIPGFKRDGAEFVPEALGRGAALVVAERLPEGLPKEAPVLVVPDARAALAALARAVHGDPSLAMAVHGITGTNGKTTTSYALHSILCAAYGEGKVGLMTTAETIVGGEVRVSERTTPESVEVQGTLAEMRESGVEHAVMEVSSHGIALKRVAGTHFRGALFTNLSRDHLDLHGTMEAYYAAKRELFRWAEGPKIANADDAHGRRLVGEIGGTLTFGESEGADYRIEGVRQGRSGTRFSLRHPGGVLHLRTPLLGGYNVQNVAGAAALALALGVPEGAVGEALAGMPQVPGRFERVTADLGLPFEVVVDYAHTDVGLGAVLAVAREAADRDGGRVLCAFGAAGERDPAKRPLMGRVAQRLADLAVVTTDDAYGEDPAEIAAEVAAGFGDSAPRPEVVLDRREAIRRVLEAAGPGDVVVVAGKGHERVQHLPDGDVPFHDATVVRELLAQRYSGRLAGAGGGGR